MNIKSNQDIRIADIRDAIKQSVEMLNAVIPYDNGLLSEVLHGIIAKKLHEYWKVRYEGKSVEELLIILRTVEDESWKVSEDEIVAKQLDVIEGIIDEQNSKGKKVSSKAKSDNKGRVGNKKTSKRD